MLKSGARPSQAEAQVELRRSADFERAYQRHASRAFAAARRILQDDAAAEDVVQDVFMTLWRNPDAFDRRRGSLATYVAMMARSRALDVYRARASRHAALERRADHDRALGTAYGAEPDEPLLRRELTRRVLDALADVPPAQRHAVLASAHGLTFEQIAVQMGVPVATAKSRARLGLTKVHAALGAV